MSNYPGPLVLVVGPSGAGKDSILSAAREHLSEDHDIVFPRRHITRAVDAGGEDHVPETEAGFQRGLEIGAYALSWQAHGLGYGVPAIIEVDLAAGRTVVVNTSRSVIDAARERYIGTQVVHVTASTDVLAERLSARGREDAADITQRLRRQAEAPIGAHVWDLVNDAGLDDAVQRFLRILADIRAVSRAVSGAMGAARAAS